MYLNNSWNKFDMFGYSPKLFISGHSKSGTVFGLITTILTFLCMLIIILYYFSKIFFFKDLTSIHSNRIVNVNESVFLNQNSSFFAFALENPINYDYYIDETIYYPKITYRTGIRGNDGNFVYKSVTLNFSECNSEYFSDDYKTIINNNTLKKMYCVPNLNLELTGTFSDDYYSFITIRLYPCKNKTDSKIICKPKENIDYYLNGTIFSVSYQNYNIDPLDFNFPMKPKLGDFYTTVSTNYYKELYIYFKKFILKTDTGLIFQDIKEENYSLFDYSMDMMNFKSINNYFMQLNIRMSTNVDENTRTYPKIQMFLSYIGGFIALIESIFSNINYFLIHNNIYEKIINKIFFISPKPKQNKRKLINFFTVIETQQLSKNFTMRYQNNFNNNFDDSVNKSLKNFMIENNNKINKDIKIQNTIKNKNSLNLISNYLTSKNKNNNNIINNFIFTQNSKSFDYTMDFEKGYLKTLKNYEKLNLPYLKILFSRFFAFNNHKINMLLKGIKIIKQKLDIISLIKDSFQLQLLTNLSFNKEHIILLDNYIKSDLNSYKLQINKINLDNINELNEETINSFDKIINRIKTNKYNNEQSKNIDRYFIDLILKQNE
jgi:hypothetical protein